MVSEARHYINFIELARHYEDEEKVNIRWKEWLDFEAQVLKALEIQPNRFH
jgi:tRNA-(ms[2]io[6]A)-hydroxylase